jgi:hypothetical protein
MFVNDIETIDNNYVKKSPIEIVKIFPNGGVNLKIGRKLALIDDPRSRFLEMGFVYLVTPDVGSANWADLVSCDIPGFGNAKGVTDDSRLVEIGKKVYTCESLDLKPGTVIPPLLEKK